MGLLYQWGGLHGKMLRLRANSRQMLSSPRLTSPWVWLARCADDNKLVGCRNLGRLPPLEEEMLSSLGKHLRFLLYPEKLAQCQLQSTWSLNSHRFINTSLLFFFRGWDNHVDSRGCTWTNSQPIEVNCRPQVLGAWFRLLIGEHNGSSCHNRQNTPWRVLSHRIHFLLLWMFCRLWNAGRKLNQVCPGKCHMSPKKEQSFAKCCIRILSFPSFSPELVCCRT